MFDREKFKRLVHYVIASAGHKDGFGATKLNKVLWFSEARTFMLTGRALTGAEFIREKYGPVPRLIMPVRDELQNAGAVRIDPPEQEYEGWRFESLRPPTMSGFSAEEVQTVDWWTSYVADRHTAKSISEESHDYGWELARLGEPLPLHAFLADRVRAPTPEELVWARGVAQRHVA